MTTIYTKPQIDAMAVKIGGEIKAAKTPVAWGNITGDITDQLDLTQRYYTKAEVDVTSQFLFDGLAAAGLNGAYYDTTTTACPNVNIAADGTLSRSTATFGTAATKNVGEAAGNVMEVGAFGLGGYQNTTRQEDETTAQALIDKLLLKGSGFFRNINPTSLSSDYATGIFGNTADTFVGITASYRSDDVRVFSGAAVESANPRIMSLWHDKNTPNSNLPVASIQAGIGAPKIAYKKLTGTLASAAGDTSVAHGLDVNKILSVDVWVVSNSGDRYSGDAPTVQNRFTKRITSTSIIINTLTTASYVIGQPFTAIITYEV